MAKPIFKSSDATGLLRYAESIFLKMTQNADLFTDPVPSMAAFEGLLNAYRDAYAEASFRDKRAVLVKAKTGKELQEAIYRLSHYVDSVAKGDRELIVAAGFIPTNPTTNRAGRTPRAEGLRVENQQIGAGRILVRIKRWKHARLYRYEYRKSGTEEWTSILHPKASIEIRDLEMMQFYEFRASYVGTDTEPSYSDVISSIVV